MEMKAMEIGQQPMETYFPTELETRPSSWWSGLAGIPKRKGTSAAGWSWKIYAKSRKV
jgi:hypothetical protein